MNPPDPLAPTDLERRLAGWAPAPPAAGRDRVLYEAGVAAGRRAARRRHAALALILAVAPAAWAAREHAARARLEVALAEQARALALAEQARASAPAQPAGLPAATPRRPAPGSYLILNRRLVGGGGYGDPAGPVPPGARLFPAPGGPTLTPLTARRLGDAVDL